MQHTRDVGAVAQRRGITAGRLGGLACVGQLLGDVIRIGAHGEADAVGVARRDLDHPRARRGDLDRHLLDVRVLEPLEAALEAVTIDGVTPEVGLHRRDIPGEARHRILRLADALHRGIAAADAEHGPAGALDPEGQRRRRRHGRVARDRVGHAGTEPDARRRPRGQHELPPHLGRQVLAVGNDEAGEAEVLDHAGDSFHPPRPGDHQEADVHRRGYRSLSRSIRYSSVTLSHRMARR